MYKCHYQLLVQISVQTSFTNFTTNSLQKFHYQLVTQISLPLHKVLYLLYKAPAYIPAMLMELQVWATCTAYTQFVIENWQTVYIYNII